MNFRISTSLYPTNILFLPMIMGVIKHSGCSVTKERASLNVSLLSPIKAFKVFFEDVHDFLVISAKPPSDRDKISNNSVSDIFSIRTYFASIP